MSQRILELVRRSQRRVVFNRLFAGLIEIVGFASLCVIGFAYWGRWAGLGGVGYGLFAGCLTCTCGFYLNHKLRQGTSLDEVAILLDREFGLYDRISSSLAFARSLDPTSYMRAHIKETAQFLERQESPVLPVSWTAQMRLWMFLGFLASFFLPPQSIPISSGSRPVAVRQKSVKASDPLVVEVAQLKEKDSLVSLIRQENMITQVEKAALVSHTLLTPADLQLHRLEEQKQLNQPKESMVDQNEDKQLDRKAGRGEKIDFASQAAYRPVGKFDSFPKKAYAQSFSEMDAILLDSSGSADELRSLSAHMHDIAEPLANFGFFDADKAMGTEGAARQPQNQGANSRVHNSFMRHLGSLHHKSFSEFLKRYAAHLGDRAQMRSGIESTKRGTRRFDTSALNLASPPPADAKLHLLSNSQAANQTSQRPQNHPNQVRGLGTQMGGRGAGTGAGEVGRKLSRRPPRAQGGEYLPLQGKLSDGRSIVSVIDDRSVNHSLVRQQATVQAVGYQQVYVHYAKGAQAELNSEKVPLQMRDYVRAYFRSIRPGEKQDP